MGDAGLLVFKTQPLVLKAKVMPPRLPREAACACGAGPRPPQALLTITTAAAEKKLLQIFIFSEDISFHS